MAKKFKVVIDPERCKGCGLCSSMCPKHLIEMSHQVNGKGYHPAAMTDNSQCVGCQSCAIMCPDCAIEIFEEDEA